MLLKICTSLAALAALAQAAALPADLEKRVGCPRGTAATATSPLVCTPCAQLFQGSQLCTAAAPTTCSAPYFLNGKACVLDCGSASFGTTNAPRTCKTCSSVYGLQALRCDESGILACKGRTKFYKGTCIATCPAKTYAAAGACIACSDPNALTCNADGSLTCPSAQPLTLGICATPVTGPYAQLRDFEFATGIPYYNDLPNTTPGQCAAFCAQNGIAYSKTAGDFAVGAERFCMCKSDSTTETVYPTNENAYGFPAYLMVPGKTCAQIKPTVEEQWQFFVDERCLDVVFTANVCSRADNGGSCY